MHAREMRRVEDRAAADAVEVGDLHRRVVVVDGIVGVARAPVRADVEIGVAARFPVAAVGGEIGRLDPVALLEAQDLHARLGQAPGHRGARGAGADDQHIDDVVGRAGACRYLLRRPSSAPLVVDVAPHRRPAAHRVEQRPVALLHAMALRKRRPRLEAERR